MSVFRRLSKVRLSPRQPGPQREIVSKLTKEELNEIYLRVISSLHVILSKGLWSHLSLGSLVPSLVLFLLGHEEPVHVTH